MSGKRRERDIGKEPTLRYLETIEEEEKGGRIDVSNKLPSWGFF